MLAVGVGGWPAQSMASHRLVGPVEVATSTRWHTVSARPASRVRPATEPRYHRCTPTSAGGQEVTACHVSVPRVPNVRVLGPSGLPFRSRYRAKKSTRRRSWLPGLSGSCSAAPDGRRVSASCHRRDPGPDLDLLVVGLGHEPGQRSRWKAPSSQPARTSIGIPEDAMADLNAAGVVASQSRPATRSSRNGTWPISACTSVFD